jgi:hypothetical protein
VTQITRVRDDEGARIRAFPRAHRLEGVPHVVFESQREQLAGRIPPRSGMNRDYTSATGSASSCIS